MKSRTYRKHVSTFPCIICGYEVNGVEDFNQAHHLLRTGEHGMGKKSGDEWCVPLCYRHHAELHNWGNEYTYFNVLHGQSHEAALQWARDTYRTWLIKSRRGGKREGAGRPRGTGKYGVPTVTLRVPKHLVSEVKRFILGRVKK